MQRARVNEVQAGSPHPPGAKPERGGVNFSVYSRHAERVELLLFDDADASAPTRVFTLDAHRHRTWHYWHLFVPGLAVGQIYAWRMHGPFDPLRGHRFDGDKLLLDPYGRAVAVPRDYRRGAAGRAGRNDAWAMKSVVAADHAYNWEGDLLPRTCAS